MHDLSDKILPHILVLAILLLVPAPIAIYLFVALYIYGIFVNAQKEKKEKGKKNQGDITPWWEVLGTNSSATVDECAYVRKLLTKIYHPDGGKAPNAEAMRRINEAFAERAQQVDAMSKGLIH